jgi:hypothetical protein
MVASKFFANRRLRLILAKKRSTTQRCGWTAKTFSMKENEPREASSSGPPPSRSWMLATGHDQSVIDLLEAAVVAEASG